MPQQPCVEILSVLRYARCAPNTELARQGADQEPVPNFGAEPVALLIRREGGMLSFDVTMPPLWMESLATMEDVHITRIEALGKISAIWSIVGRRSWMNG